MSSSPRTVALTLCVVASSIVAAVSMASTARADAPRSVVYVVNESIDLSGNNSITAYALSSSGNASPVARIAGPDTRLGIGDYGSTSPTGIAHDAAGDLFVTTVKTTFPSTGFILEFAPGANGDVAPIRVIGGPNTHLVAPGLPAIDPSGAIYVPDTDSSAILEFPAGSTGDVAPSAIIKGPDTHLDVPVSLALDPAGNIYVANQGHPVSSGPPDYSISYVGGSIVEYAAGARGDVSPIRRIAGPLTAIGGTSVLGQIVRDPVGDLYVTNPDAGDVTEFAPSANGDVAPIATIKGSNTGLQRPYGLALDSQGSIVVGDYEPASLREYALGSNGNVSPVNAVSGSNTELESVPGIDVIDAAATRLTPATTSKRRRVFSATLTRADASHAPVPGRTLVFSTKAPLSGRQDVVCRATTDASGTATCLGVIPGADRLDGSYAVSFTGDVDYLSATASGRLTP